MQGVNFYLLYLIIASSTIASPGPGVVMTLTNSLRYGLKNSIAGILGVSLGMFFIALLAGGGVGVVFSRYPLTYTVLKIAGAVYLFYLGARLIKNRNRDVVITADGRGMDKKKSFIQGIWITVINPKPIVFFIALFPQFIKSNESYLPQFAILSATFCVLIVLIHVIYGLFANFLKTQSKSHNYFKYVNTFGGLAYIIFAVSLLAFAKNT